MKRYFYIFAIYLWISNQLLWAAVPVPLAIPALPRNPACFNFEIFSHGANIFPVGMGNAAVAFYGYGQIETNHNHMLFPAVGMPVDVMVSFRKDDMPISQWANFPLHIPAVPPALVLPVASRTMALRNARGIRVSPGLFVAVAAAVVAPAPPPPALLTSLRNGGYLMRDAEIIHFLRTPPVGASIFGIPIFGPGGIGFVPSCIVIHIAQRNRISKNVRDLAHNSISTPGVPPVPPISIKDQIDSIYHIAGVQAPKSATVISSNHIS